jgi:hypothetical protein
MSLEKATQIVYSLCFTKGRSNGTNVYVKFYLNHGPQEPEIYNANIPGVGNMIRLSLMKINYPEGLRGSPDHRLGNSGLGNVGS